MLLLMRIFIKTIIVLMAVSAYACGGHLFKDQENQVRSNRQLREHWSNVGFLYSRGDNIQKSYQIFYQSYSSDGEHRLKKGIGFTLTYYDILNEKDQLEGTLLSYNPRFAVQYLFAPGKTYFYVGASVKVSFGTESIDYGFKEDKNFFIGPILEEQLGITFNDRFAVEAGLFQLKLFGADLLPSDVGIIFGFHIIF